MPIMIESSRPEKRQLRIWIQRETDAALRMRMWILLHLPAGRRRRRWPTVCTWPAPLSIGWPSGFVRTVSPVWLTAARTTASLAWTRRTCWFYSS